MNNNGNGRHFNNAGSNMPGRRSMNVTFYEPVAANAAIFVALIILDVINKNNNLIPFHSVAGIIITLMTLALCRYNYLMLAWVFVILPAAFFVVSSLIAISQNKYVIDLKTNIADTYGTVSKHVAAGYDKLEDTVEYGYNSAVNAYDYVEDTAADTVSYLNNAGQEISSSVGNRYDTFVFNNAAWMKSYEIAKANGNVSLATAVAIATATNGSPPIGTQARKIADDVIKNSPVVVPGEYDYMCISDTKLPAPGMSDVCTRCAADNVTDKDECIASSATPPPLVCLGALATTKSPPNATERDKCMECGLKSITQVEKDACRTAAIAGKPWPVPEVTPESVVTGADPQITTSSAAATPVAATAAGFTNYGGNTWW